MMKSLAYQPSYDPQIGPAKVVLDMHSTQHRGWFGLGRRRCDTCGEPWTKYGCSAHIEKMQTYLQVSTPEARAEDLKNHPHLFTTAEHEQISAADACSKNAQVEAMRVRSEREWAAAGEAIIWQDPYPDPATAAFWGLVDPTGTHETIRELAPTAGVVPHQRRPQPIEPVAA